MTIPPSRAGVPVRGSDSSMDLHFHLPLLIQQRFDDFLAETHDPAMAQTPEGVSWRLLAANMRAAHAKKPMLFQTLAAAMENYVSRAEPEPKPIPAWSAEWEPIAQVLAADAPSLFCGLRTAHLLERACQEAPARNLERLSAIHFGVDHPMKLLEALRRMNWTRSSSPLTHPAVMFWVGSDWLGALRTQLNNDLLQPLPRGIFGPDDQTGPARAALGELGARRKNATADSLARRGVELEMLSRTTLEKLVLGRAGEGERRVLVVGNRFHPHGTLGFSSTRAAMEKAGWKVRGLIEQTPQQRVNRHAVAKAMEDMKPHLVVSVYQPLLDDPRVLPENLPSIAIRSGRGKARSGDARHTVGIHVSEAFDPEHMGVATSPQIYLAPGLCPYKDALAALGDSMEGMELRSLGHTGLGSGTMVYSLQDAPPAAHDLLAQAQAAVADRSGPAQVLVRSLVADLLAGRITSKVTTQDLTRLAAERAGRLPKAEVDACARAAIAPARVAFILDTLRMARSVCEGQGYAFVIHGHGWERYPEFAPLAKPRPRNREEFVRLVTRGACAIHAHPGSFLNQGYLDLVSTGAMVLVRRHAFHAVARRFAMALYRRAPKAKAIAEVPADTSAGRELRAAADALRDALPHADAGLDLVPLMRQAIAGGVYDRQMQIVPQVDRVEFGDPGALAILLSRWVPGAEERQRLVEAQRQSLLERMGLDAHLRRAFRAMSGRIDEEPEEDGGDTRLGMAEDWRAAREIRE